MTSRPSAPVYLSIAGSDCSAGAGIQADLKAGCAMGCYPLTAITCVVSEVPGNVNGIKPMDAEFVARQIKLCLRHFPVRAIKTGMLYAPAIVEAVAAELHATTAPLVVDPVMIATAGEPLMLQEAIETYEKHLIPRASILTPNLDELKHLLSSTGETSQPQNEAELTDAACALSRHYNCAILAKGGHLSGTVCTDILALPDGSTRCWKHPRTEGISTHGTGCTLSSALAARLAAGDDLTTAAERALRYVSEAIRTSLRWGSIDALNHMLSLRPGQN